VPEPGGGDEERRIARILGAVRQAAEQARADELAAVAAEIERLRSSKTGPLGNLLALAVSLGLFVTLGRFAWGWETLLLLLVVVLLHEAGHYAGMKLLGYADVSMFFIPLFGGAASGRPEGVPGWRRAAVALLGPVPGLFLGLILALAAAWFKTDERLLGKLATGFILINAFNLLPFHPLDGGHLLGEVLYCRNRHAEFLVRAASGLALAAVGLWLKQWVLAGLGLWGLAWSGGNLRTAGAAERLAEALPETVPAPASPGGVPPEALSAAIAEVHRTWPYLETPADVALKVEALWDRASRQPPGLLASAALLALYAGLLAVSALALGAFLYGRATGTGA
jgi:Zn-dependent protease